MRPPLLHCTALPASQIPQTFPLVATVDGRGVDLAAWSTFARRWLLGYGAVAERRGAITARVRRGTIYGLFFHRVTDDPHHGRVFEVTQLRVVEPGRLPRVLDALDAALQSLATHCRCDAVVVELSPSELRPDGADVAFWAASGYRPTALRLRRPTPLSKGAAPEPQPRKNLASFIAGARQTGRQR